MNRCVITGATGLIGSQLLPWLVPDWEVHALARDVTSGQRNGVYWHATDLRTLDTTVLPSRTDAVIFLAQSEHFREFPDRAQDIFDVNVASLMALLDYARRSHASHFVVASSGGVYRAGDQELNEELEIATRRDLGFYLGTKLCGEILAEQYASLFTVIMLRFFFVYGPGQASHMLVPRLVHAVRRGTSIQLAGADGIRINPTYVDDAAQAVLRALDLRHSHRINVGGPEVLSLRELAQIIGETVGATPVFEIDRSATPRHLVADTRKMRELLHEPVVAPREGIGRLVCVDSATT